MTYWWRFVEVLVKYGYLNFEIKGGANERIPRSETFKADLVSKETLLDSQLNPQLAESGQFL